MTEQQGGSYSSPFDHSTTPTEPPRGAVLAYQRLGRDGVVLDYVSFRAGDGRWYTTGRNAQQGVAWDALLAALRHQAYGSVHYATSWAELDVPWRVPGEVQPTSLLPRRPVEPISIGQWTREWAERHAHGAMGDDV